MTKKRGDRLRAQAAKVDTTAAEVQDQAQQAEDLLTRLEDRDEHRELRRRRYSQGR